MDHRESERPSLTARLRRDGVEVYQAISPLDFHVPEGAQHRGLEEFPEQLKFLVDHLFHNCKAYLTGVIMRDGFGIDHAKRRAWRTEMRKTYGDKFERLDQVNKLRFNLISNLQTYFSAIVNVLNEHEIGTPEAKGLRRIAAMMPQVGAKTYGTLSDEDKLGIVAETEEAARELILFLTKPVDTV